MRTMGMKFRRGLFGLALSAVGCLLAVGGWTGFAQAQSAETGTPLAPSAVVKKPIPSVVKTATRPSWAELTSAQQQALKPLAANWSNISEGHKRKWLAISQNFSSLPSSEQQLIHGRMTEWAALSPQERSLARLNYAGARELSADERLAKWQAYQALSPEQKQKLAATGPVKPVGAATAVKPVAPQKLTATPVAVKATGSSQQATVRPPPKIAATADQLDLNTLLPVNDPSTSP